ncbi:hypothetical protein ACIRBX_23365 [Kitasatospora sp. NPDC096147]|uniref:hypothetical protein n=1 Tax=Kitasatospora sp. NPDC096147 TaxID=3364093 RepID=UPI003822FC5C
MAWHVGRTCTALALGLALGTATACSPPLGRAVGLTRDGDVLTVLTPLCERGELGLISVSEYDSEEPHQWRAHQPWGSGLGGVRSFPLFTAPPGWTVDSTTLTALRPGPLYFLTVTHSGSDAKESRLGFTVADVERLQPGEVLAKGHGGKTVVLSVKEFRAKALDDC